MRIFTYWQRASRSITIAGDSQTISAYGGSNESDQAARSVAERRLDRVEAKIAGRPLDDRDYESDIREEILDRPLDGTVVTRNRYGACILNTSRLMMLDLDEPRTGFFDLFANKTPAWKKDKICSQVRKQAASWPDLTFRVYETHAGIRVLVFGADIDPRSNQAQGMFRQFHVDRLFASLCHRQNCYRARLTPKPYRARVQGHRVRFPREPDEDAALRAWLPSYTAACERYATCLFRETVGRDVSHPLIDYHDHETRAFSRKDLA